MKPSAVFESLQQFGRDSHESRGLKQAGDVVVHRHRGRDLHESRGLKPELPHANKNLITSRLTRVAWIETGRSSCNLGAISRRDSHESRGLKLALGDALLAVYCRDSHESRGLKLANLVAVSTLQSRDSHESRGLKHVWELPKDKTDESRLTRVAWIETHSLPAFFWRLLVATHTSRVD